MKKRVVRRRKEYNTGLFVPGCLFIGLAFGFAYNQIVVGTLGGLGVGFLLMALFRLVKK